MADLLAILGMTGLFALAILFVFACDKIIGRDEEALAEETGQPVAPAPKPVREAA
jgi:hypothetical protein